MDLPNDPAILLSYINTMLRDKYSNLDALCDDYNTDKDVIIEKLRMIGYEYSEDHNRFK